MAPHPAPPPPAPDDAPRVAVDFARPVLERQLAGLAQLSEIGLRIVGRLDRASARYEAAAEAADAAAVAVRSAPAAPAEPDDDDLDDDLGDVVAQIAANEIAARDAAANDAAPHPLPVVETAASLAFARASRAVRQTYALETQVIEQLRRVAGIEQSGVDDARREVAARERARKDRVGRIVTRIVAEQADGDTEAFTRLCHEASERLSDREVFGDLLNTPISDAIAAVCRDLGLDPDWPGLGEESWARDELRSGMVGKALKTLLARDPNAEPLPPPRRRTLVPRVVIPQPLPTPPPSSTPNVRIILQEAPAHPEPRPASAPPPTPIVTREPTADPPPAAPAPHPVVALHEGPHALPGELPPSRRPRPPPGAYRGAGGFMG